MPRPAPPPVPRSDWQGINTASLVTGILAFVLPVIGIPLAVLALGLGYHARRRAAPHRPPRAGIVLGTIALCLQIPAIGAMVGMSDGGDMTFGESAAPAAQEPAQFDYGNPALAQLVVARGAPTPAPLPAGTPADALDTTTLIEGQGQGAVPGNTLIVHLVGALADGSIFQSSWLTAGTPVVVTLPAGEPMNGWEQGLVGAKPGERRRIVLGPENAAGSAGGGGVPPNSPVVYEVDVLDIQHVRPVGEVQPPPPPEPATTVPVPPSG